jgi:hypothetical protein
MAQQTNHPRSDPASGPDERLELHLPADLFARLSRIAAATGLHDPAEAAIVGLAEWTAAREAQLDDRDPGRKYFVNAALDELLDSGKSSR